MRLYPPRGAGGEEFRHPDEERYPNDRWHILNFQLAEDNFAESGNPAHAMHAILYAYDAGIVPPVWAMDWLATGLRRYLDSEGREDIAQSLGAKAAGKGKARPVPAYFADAQRSRLAWTVYILNRVFNVPIGEAAVMAWAEKNGADDDPDGRKSGWLEEQYRRRWRAGFEATGAENVLHLFSDEESRRQFLTSFPPEVIPYGLK